MIEIELIKSFSIFSFLDVQSLTEIKNIINLLEYKDNDIVFNEGGPGDALYLIVNGKVRISKIIDAEKNTSKDLAILTAGEFFGEMSLFTEEIRSASVYAIGNTSLGRISKEDFNNLLKKDVATSTRLLFAIITTLNKRLRETNLQLVTVYDTGKIIGKMQTLEDTAGQILNRLRSTINAEQSILALKNDVMETIDITAQQPFNLNISNIKNISLTEGIIGKTISEQKSFLINDFEKESETADIKTEGYENKSILSVPVISQDKSIGAIVFTHSNPDFFNYSHLNLAAGVASQTGAAIINAKYKQDEMAKEKSSRQYVSF